MKALRKVATTHAEPDLMFDENRAAYWPSGVAVTEVECRINSPLMVYAARAIARENLFVDRDGINVPVPPRCARCGRSPKTWRRPATWPTDTALCTGDDLGSCDFVYANENAARRLL